MGGRKKKPRGRPRHCVPAFSGRRAKQRGVEPNGYMGAFRYHPPKKNPQGEEG